MVGLRTRLIHLKIFWFGDKELEQGSKVIPCRNCEKPFESFPHYRDDRLVFDTHCDKCQKR